MLFYVKVKGYEKSSTLTSKSLSSYGFNFAIILKRGTISDRESIFAAILKGTNSRLIKVVTGAERIYDLKAICFTRTIAITTLPINFILQTFSFEV